MRIIILGYTGLIGSSILENLANNSSVDLVCVGRDIKNKLIRFIIVKQPNL